ncbi:hypothetical protein C5748_26765 [Phyllobacterium phragmitis]|uniref:DNA lyase n=1 Tax=Phyllobacterium phragmitis TaxID=2670329 RepID=A0A2S9IIY3_9HYPH|nr:hypothetical protein [Phyllobacterium phragmitis]PRD40477.1 hypothetical protein C5748_26765 [Phyllobacterium phragmitis]
MQSSAIQMLVAARRVADYALEVGADINGETVRASYHHMGAIVADCVLQAGLNYRSVVLPRISAILERFPGLDRTSELVELVARGETSRFLNWHHPEKIDRFEALVSFLSERSVENAPMLRDRLQDASFVVALLEVRGVGPKTVDYMQCLVGIDSIAVDRHVRTFAKRVGVVEEDYDFLKSVFCYAADLLCVSRREFDAWVWRREASVSNPQLVFSF